MTEFDTALWWARVRAAGPQRITPGRAAPAGMRRLVEVDAAGVWLMPNLPDGARPTVLDELGLPAPLVEQPNDTARVLATCLRCCWGEPGGPIWPGVIASWSQIVTVFRGITDNRDQAASNRALVGGIRRLSGAGWLRWNEASRNVQLGPRVTAWSEPELSSLRELLRLMPPPVSEELPDGGT
ncbi:hypothetical protein Nm8I071_56840 [Nonomuraea sp. TT08I-71]|nr:hypothetical protein Nm8I071_56840 [Nonomuraea sp. TT08I-71]